MKEKTAVQRLIHTLTEFDNQLKELKVKSNGDLYVGHGLSIAIDEAHELLSVERQQIDVAYDRGLKDSTGITTADLKFGAKYFNEKYE